MTFCALCVGCIWKRRRITSSGSPAREIDATGRSWIGYDDYAIALVDELAQGNALKARITIDY